MAESVVSPLLSVISEKLVAAVDVIDAVDDRTATSSVVHTLFRKLNISHHNRELLNRELKKLQFDRTATSSVVHTLFRKSNISHHNRELLNRELKKLHSSISALEPLIVESEKCLEVNKDLMKFKQIKDAAFEVDDILDQLFLFSSSSNSMVHKVSNSFSLSKNSTFSRILRRIKHVTEMFDEMIDHRVWGDPLTARLGYLTKQIENRELYRTTPDLSEPQVYGREGDKMKIVDMLISLPEEEDLSFISIVGMGGLGKTTLAKLVYNDEWVVRYFEKRVWIHVGQVFDEAKIVQKIIETVEGVSCSFEQMSLLAGEALEVLQGRRFLIVLDDLWNAYGERCDPLKDLLRRSSCEGCKILVTTRSVEVARIIGTSSMFHLGALSDEHCRALIFDQASRYQLELKNIPELLGVAKDWAKKCKGLPLAAKVVGSEFFNRKHDRVLASLDEGISSLLKYEMVLNSLKLSYDYLASDLKECFAYCSIFPKGCTIKKENLIQLWMAEGFIQSSQQRITLEEIGNDYFMKLLWMSFFQAAEQDGCGNIIEFTMHDCVHDLAQSVSKIGSSILKGGEAEKTSHNVCYLSLVCGPTLTEIPKSLFSQSLRTLLFFSASKYLKRVPDDTFSSFRCLRVLDLSRTGICKLPASVCMLMHLRYLDLSHGSIKKLPKSFSTLMNLQTLKLSDCYRLLELPKDLETMVNLRHLNISQCCSLSHLPSGFGQLTCLQTLSMFIVGKDKQCSLKELRWLNLGGKLEIKNLKHVTNFLDADEANLMEKLNLQSLGLSWGHEYTEDLDRCEGYVLERLQPHSNLKELSITGCKTVYFPEWIENLSNLVKISIINFRHCNYLPSLGQLPHLKYLYIKGMDAIECIDYAFYGDGALKGFPSLEEIEIYNMPKLEEWLTLPESRDAFTHLNKLTVKGCPYLTSLPFFSVLSYLTLWGSNKSLLSSVGYQPLLSSLVINDFQDLISLPDEIGNSNSLKKITVYNCNNLISILENGNSEWLTSLEQLSILYCKDLRYLSAQTRHLISLQRLDIIQCPQLTYLPELIELTSLQALTIDGCPRFASFPNGMHRMVSLQELRIRRCPNLQYLPMGFEHITSLLYLEIGGCNILESRLQMDGQDWHKIAHIPTISFVKI